MTAGNAPSRRARRTDRRVYLAAALVIFLVEVAIARFVSGGFVRHTLGDVLVVALLYCALMASTRLDPVPAAVACVGFAFAVEAAQAAAIVERLGLSHLPLARIVIGTTFSWGDLLAYAAGGALALVADYGFGGRRLRDRPS